MGRATTSALHPQDSLSRVAKLCGLVLLLSAPIVFAQEKLGELLDAGAKVLSSEDFKQELVQRVLVGPTSSGVGIEIVYTAKGLVQGSASGLTQGMGGLLTPINGEWKVDENGRICTSMRFGLAYGPGGGMTLPFRCQVWFKLADRYYLSDSDSDRQTRVLRRTVKQ